MFFARTYHVATSNLKIKGSLPGSFVFKTAAQDLYFSKADAMDCGNLATLFGSPCPLRITSLTYPLRWPRLRPHLHPRGWRAIAGLRPWMVVVALSNTQSQY